MHTVQRAGEMFPLEVDSISGNLRWDPREGWRLYLKHHHTGESGWECVPLELDRLSYSELVTALDTYVWEVRGY